jgi:flagellar biogenesis protein FliO
MQAIALLYTTPEVSGSLWSEYLKTLFVLIGTCMLAMAAAKLVVPRLRATFPGSGLIRVLASQPLEPRKMLYIVKAGDTAVLLATSGNAVHFLTKLEDSANLEIEQATEPNRETGVPAFRNITRFIGGRYRRKQS